MNEITPNRGIKCRWGSANFRICGESHGPFVSAELLDFGAWTHAQTFIFKQEALQMMRDCVTNTKYHTWNTCSGEWPSRTFKIITFAAVR